MANTNAPSGLTAVRHYSGGMCRLNDYRIASALATSIFYGDPVKSTGTGKEITVCAANDAAVGVFAGVTYNAADGMPTFSKSWQASTATLAGSERQCLVYDDPNIIFEIQASAGFVAANVGAGADYSIGAGTAQTGISTTQLDSATISAAGTLAMKIVGLVPRPDNAYGTNAKVLVLINKHEMKASVAAV